MKKTTLFLFISVIYYKEFYKTKKNADICEKPKRQPGIVSN